MMGVMRKEYNNETWRITTTQPNVHFSNVFKFIINILKLVLIRI